MRINKFFTENGICSRREADKWVDASRVSINGRVAVHGDKVQAGDLICVDSNPVVIPKKRPVIVAFNKPVGIECTSDPRVENNVIYAVNHPQRIFHIGRLDVMSEGLILLTNMGDIVNRILRSRYEHEKEYIVALDQPISRETVETLSRGVDIGDDRGPTKPCFIETMGRQRLRIILTEGRNRQIRRMMEAVGLRAVRLKRIRVMNVVLGELKSGSWRELTPRETDDLMGQLEETSESFDAPSDDSFD